MSWDMELQYKERTILLFVDSGTSSFRLSKKYITGLSAPDTTSLVQPMDMGIIKNLKTFYRRKLVNYIIEKIEEKLVTSSSTSKEISAKINILQAVQFVADTWRATSTKTIKNY